MKKKIYKQNLNIRFDSSPAVNCFNTAICCRSLTIRRCDAKSAATDPRLLFDAWLVELEDCSIYYEKLIRLDNRFT